MFINHHARLTALLTIALVVWGRSAMRVTAHEAGTTRVTIALSDHRTYDVEVVTDAAALVEKLNAVADKPAPVDLRAERLQAQCVDAVDDFRERVSLTFDGTSVRPDIQMSVAAAADSTTPPVATIHLTGDIPAQAQQLQWKFGWTFTSYQLTVRRSGVPATAASSLDGDQLSPPISVVGPVVSGDRPGIFGPHLARGFRRIVPMGIDQMLFILAVSLMNRRPRSLALQVAALVAAETVAIAFGVYGGISVSPRLIEPLMAASIACVAIGNICRPDVRGWRLAFVFACGLLQGLALVQSLVGAAVTEAVTRTTVTSFTLGVVAGQLTVVLVAFALVGAGLSRHQWYRGRVVVPASAALACTALFWTLERLSF